eukprot:CAMPEP_0114133312 /NCGR_PEP_ID=MMETSP0043_2-20121206/13559_1 /TAXON_ID=464988 /ORGANISM="Hemiselmis andersenii, Strain CCMP644" /LENGTH=466 /DNA_ID=CAMNT_0001226881 /DNA_START=19 /DNA_END=1415 /DNA_ORIENTATION=+
MDGDAAERRREFRSFSRRARGTQIGGEDEVSRQGLTGRRAMTVGGSALARVSGRGFLPLVAAALVLSMACGVTDAQDPLLEDSDKYAWVYAVGNNGAILRSTNAGETWRVQDQDVTGTSQHLQDVFFFDARSGYVVGENSAIIVTHNAGWNWDEVGLSDGETDGPKVNLTGIHLQRFPGPAYVVGHNGLFAKSEDGEVWSIFAVWCKDAACVVAPFADEAPPAEGHRRLGRLHAVRFKDMSNGLIVGDDGLVLLTQDGSEEEPTFERVQVFADVSRPWPNITGIDMDDLGHMVMVGDRGVVFKVKHKSNPDNDKLNFEFFGCNLAQGCAAATPAAVATGEGGCSVSDRHLGAVNTVVSGESGKDIIVVGGTQGFLALLDESEGSGNEWTTPAVPVAHPLERITSLYVSTAKTHILVTDRGNIYRTTDGEAEAPTYTRIAVPEGFSFRRVSGRNADDESPAGALRAG